MADKEYINKVAFNYAIREAVKKYPNSFYNGLEVARQIAHDFPAADVRPVVSCCDCKHFQVNVSPSGYLPQGVPEWECRHWCRPTDPTDFCSYGKKREES